MWVGSTDENDVFIEDSTYENCAKVSVTTGGELPLICVSFSSRVKSIPGNSGKGPEKPFAPQLSCACAHSEGADVYRVTAVTILFLDRDPLHVQL